MDACFPLRGSNCAERRLSSQDSAKSGNPNINLRRCAGTPGETNRCPPAAKGIFARTKAGCPRDTRPSSAFKNLGLSGVIRTIRANHPIVRIGLMPILECRKWGFKRWGFKQIRGHLRKNAFFLRFLDFPGALWALRKRAKKAEKGRKRPISADFRGREARHTLKPPFVTPPFAALQL